MPALIDSGHLTGCRRAARTEAGEPMGGDQSRVGIAGGHRSADRYQFDRMQDAVKRSRAAPAESHPAIQGKHRGHRRAEVVLRRWAAGRRA